MRGKVICSVCKHRGHPELGEVSVPFVSIEDTPNSVKFPEACTVLVVETISGEILRASRPAASQPSSGSFATSPCPQS